MRTFGNHTCYKIFILVALFIVSSVSTAAGTCNPTPTVSKFIFIINKIYRQSPLWISYPTTTQFVAFDYEGSSSGYFISKNESLPDSVSSLLTNCDHVDAWKIIDPLVKTRVGYFPHCGFEAPEEACNAYPGVKTIFKLMDQPIGIHVLDRERFGSIQNTLFGDHGKKYDIDQIGVYNVIHEMFHEYQDASGFSAASVNSSRSWDTCQEENPEWATRFEKERQWWAQKLPTVYSPDSTRDDLKELAIEFIEKIRPESKRFHSCDLDLKSHERTEGVAHFVGHASLLNTGLATPSFLALIDTQYLQVPIDVHSVMWVYATGGAISKLNDRLVGEAWKQIVQDGWSPYDILSDFVKGLQK